jgi:hypothetical protein
MSIDLETLARRAVACSKWHWMPGMLALGHNKERRILEITDGEPYWYGDGYRFRLIDGFPDLSDPATVGCLLTLVREAWRTSSLHTRLGVDGWEVRDTYCTVIYDKPTAIVCGLDWVGAGSKSDPNGPHTSEIEALVVALEAAP